MKTCTLHTVYHDFPFIFLTLILSLQASYATPLILLAQNRQADRDRIALNEDRAQNERSIADTEYLTRELAALRNSLGEVATRDFVRAELADLVDELAKGKDENGQKVEFKTSDDFDFFKRKLY